MKLIANEILLNAITGGSAAANEDDNAEFLPIPSPTWLVEGGLVDWPPLPPLARFPKMP